MVLGHAPIRMFRHCQEKQNKRKQSTNNKRKTRKNNKNNSKNKAQQKTKHLRANSDHLQRSHQCMGEGICQVHATLVYSPCLLYFWSRGRGGNTFRDYRLQIADYRIDCRLLRMQIADYRTDCTTDCRVQITGLIADCRLQDWSRQ